MRKWTTPSLICDCDGAELLRPQHFVVVCELTSIHDDFLSRLGSGLLSYFAVVLYNFSQFMHSAMHKCGKGMAIKLGIKVSG